MTSHRVAVVLGTRPELLKLAPVVEELSKWNSQVKTDVILTGQHRELLHGLLDLFGMNNCIQLPVENTVPNLTSLTMALVDALDGKFQEQKYDAIIVQGDTTTAFAAGLVAFYHHIPIAHVEAGLRTRNMSEPFPEEANRQLLSRLSRWHFAPTEEARGNLIREDIPGRSIAVTGNTVIDSLHMVIRNKTPENYETTLLAAEAPELFESLAKFRASGGRTLSLLTLHRRENQGDKLDDFFRSIRAIAAAYPDHHMVYPYHLNPAVREKAFSFLSNIPNVHLIAPLSYRPFLYLMDQVDFAASDSGGVQEEFPSFRKPLLILRDVTERPEVVMANMGRLIGTDPVRAIREFSDVIEKVGQGLVPEWFKDGTSPFGDGYASQRIVERILSDLGVAQTTERRIEEAAV